MAENGMGDVDVDPAWGARDPDHLGSFTRALLESLSDRVGVVACDADGRLTLMNEIAREWRVPSGMPEPAEGCPGRAEFFRSDGVTPLTGAELPVLRALRGETVHDVEIVLRAEGEPPRPLLVRASAVRGEGGVLLGAVAIHTDLSSLRTAEAARRSSERRFELFMDHLPASAIIKGADSRIVWANRTARESFPGRELVGECLPISAHGPEADRMLTDDRRVIAGNPVVRVERLVDGAGRERLKRSYKFPIPEEGGGVLVGLVALDVTEEVRAQREAVGLSAEMEERVRRRTADLEEAVREIEGLSYSVSHDLRAPLRAIDGFSGMLLEGHSERLDVEGRRLLEAVRSNAVRMSELIDDLLEFSRAGQGELASGPVDMTALVRAVLSDVESADPSSVEGVDVRVGALPAAQGDAGLLRTVWASVLDNALKFTRPKSSRVVEVSGWEEAGRRFYRVKDNGVGFDARYVDKIFGVFQRLHGAREFPGSGLGLALVKRIVLRHGGEVRAEGREGEGAEITFVLPGPEGGRSGPITPGPVQKR
jgi:PAS domain S-box-containing protein